MTSDGEVIVLEVKCPVAGLTKIVKPDYLNKQNKLKKGSAYYAQVQTQLLACDAKLAYFYVYGHKNSIRIHVPRDDKFI